MPFTLTDDPQFYGLALPLSNILINGLFCSNNRLVVFYKTEKKLYRIRGHTIMRSIFKGDRGS